MTSGIESLDRAYGVLFTIVLILMAVLVMLCLVRAIIGPRTADRIVSVNMMGTMVIVMIAVLTLLLGEGYLADICLIYAMISFLAVIVLTKVYMGVYLEKKEMEGKNTQRVMQENKKPEGRRAESGNGNGVESEGGNSEGMELNGKEPEGNNAERVSLEGRGLAGGKSERGRAEG